MKSSYLFHCVLNCIVVAFLCIPLPSVAEDVNTKTYPLKVYYIEFPPYYFTNAEMQPDGFLLKHADSILRTAGIIPTYVTLPAKRVLQELRTPAEAVSIGWFKTQSRENFAQFSKSIYRNKPLQIMYLAKNAQMFDSHKSIAEVLMDKSLILGLPDGYSYGNEMDKRIEDLQPTTASIVGGFPQLVRMLAAERFSYLLVAPEEAAILIRKNRLNSSLFRRQSFPDCPEGNLRYFMYSRSVPASVIQRVDRMIDELSKVN